jgi:hypothetical protein
VNREQVLDELATDVRAVLGDRKVRTHDDKTAAIVALVADLLGPGLAAVEPVGARIPVETLRYGNAAVEIDANGDVARIELDVPVELEWHERQE